MLEGKTMNTTQTAQFASRNNASTNVWLTNMLGLVFAGFSIFFGLILGLILIKLFSAGGHALLTMPILPWIHRHRMRWVVYVMRLSAHHGYVV